MKLSNDPGRPKAVHLFMFMFYWCEQRELCPGKVNQSFSFFFRLPLTLRGLGFSHPFILTFYSCRLLSLPFFLFLFSSLTFIISSRHCLLRFIFFLKRGSAGSLFRHFIPFLYSHARGLTRLLKIKVLLPDELPHFMLHIHTRMDTGVWERSIVYALHFPRRRTLGQFQCLEFFASLYIYVFNLFFF